MSVRAYKIIKIETDESPTFNCWHDVEILEFANQEQTNSDGCGIIEFSRDTLEELIEEKDNSDDLRKVASDILADFAKDDDYIEYYCY